MALPVAEAADRLRKSTGSSLSAVFHAYQTQISRLSSFSLWPHFSKLSALAFSSSGFYYTGHGDEVACFACGLRLGQWTAGMLPADVHTELSGGQCTFLSENRRSCKLVLGEISDGLSAKYNLVTLPEHIVAVSSVLSTHYGDEAHFQTSASSATPRQRCDVDALKREAYRLSTYTNVWKSSNFVSPKELAAAGFHYAGPGDRVQCAFCQGLLRNWEPGDRAMALHAQHFAYCRFVQGHDVGNVPIPYKPLIAEPALTEDTVFPEESDAALGISRAVPTHPDLALETHRRATFATWQESICAVTPEAMAKAGFFYLGIESCVKCFHCDGTISNWSTDADPWVKHARHYPDCAFVNQVKGRSYVAQMMSSLAEDRGISQSTKFPVDPREIRARVDTAKVRILLQMDYPLDLIREALQQRLASRGSDCETSEALLADVFTTHDKKQRTANATQGRPQKSALPLVINGVPRALPASQTSSSSIDASETFLVGGTRASALSVYSSEKSSALTATTVNGCVANRDQQATLPSVRVGRTARDKSTAKASEENQHIKMQLTCKICMDGVIGIVFLPCGHFVCCSSCAPALTLCPICRVSIRGSVRCVL